MIVTRTDRVRIRAIDGVDVNLDLTPYDGESESDCARRVMVEAEAAYQAALSPTRAEPQ